MESADQYGPALPPGLVTTSEASPKSIEESSVASSSVSRRKLVGPQLPPGHQQSVEDSDDLSDEGPLTVKMESPTTEARDSGDNSQDDSVVGPMPSEMSQDGEDVVQAAEEFERRSKRMKDKLLVKNEADEGPQKREEWMTELPPEMTKNFGLQNRNFMKSRTDDDGGDRSSWTETPATKKEKQEGKGKKRKRDEEKAASAREDQMQQQVEEYNKANRPDSLLEMHTKKQKKKKKKEKKEKKKKKERGEKEEKEARRPFDRDLDLQVNKFDDAQRKLIIQRSQALNSRFKSGGSTSSFL